MQYRAALSRISHAKNTQADPAGFLQERGQQRERSCAAIFEEYEKALRTANALDFDDLLLEAVRLLRTRRRHSRGLEPPPELRHDRRVSGHQPQPVRADAAADRGAQECLRGGRRGPVDLQLARRGHPQYSGFRAAIFPNAQTIRLEQNYRSTKNILAAAGAVVENNKARKGKKLWTEADAGEMLGLYAGYDAENEALFIADTIEKHLASNPGRPRGGALPDQLRNRGRSKRRCAATGASTTWWAASVSISARKSKTPSRT